MRVLVCRVEALSDFTGSMGGREVREARIFGFRFERRHSSLRSFRAAPGGSNNKNLAYLPSSLQLPVNLAGSLATSLQEASSQRPAAEGGYWDDLGALGLAMLQTSV